MARFPGPSLSDIFFQMDGILVRLPNWMGDMLMARPALKYLKIAGISKLVGLVPERYLMLARLFPELDEVFSIEAVIRMNNQSFRDYLGLALPNSLRSALDLRRAGCRFIVGYHSPERAFFLTHSILPPAGKEWEVKRFFRLSVALINGLKGSGEDPDAIPEVEPLSYNSLHSPINEDFKGPVVIHTGASKPQRRWPLHRFIRLARWLVSRADRPVILLLDEDDQQVPEDIQYRVYPPFEELLNLCTTCSLFIGNDAGPAHLAAAFNRKTVILYGPGHPVLHRPAPGAGEVYPVTLDWPCSPCRQRFWKECRPIEDNIPACLYALHVEDVQVVVEPLL